jgi:hypothetical protein
VCGDIMGCNSVSNQECMVMAALEYDSIACPGVYCKE